MVSIKTPADTRFTCLGIGLPHLAAHSRRTDGRTILHQVIYISGFSIRRGHFLAPKNNSDSPCRARCAVTINPDMTASFQSQSIPRKDSVTCGFLTVHSIRETMLRTVDIVYQTVFADKCSGVAPS
ncbi:MAG: hypothetical protein HDS79_01370 [Bacteroidales bacterium]|nr:hypothetical protein [Bacteroidales bacterium]MDE7466615.1 S-ribosylhomocysteine lyase [Muribaculaceae bacterium]